MFVDVFNNQFKFNTKNLRSLLKKEKNSQIKVNWTYQEKDDLRVKYSATKGGFQLPRRSKIK